jgi:hypothetical protein
MPELGFALSSEDHPPNELVRQAVLAERAGFTFALISDHFHPWIDAQGNSPFVWSTLGGIAQATESIRVGTGVTCPISRISPAIVAQAAATVAAAALSYRYVEMPIRNGDSQRRLKAWLDRHTPHQRLGWVVGIMGAVAIAAAVAFGQPGSSTGTAFASTGTPAGLSRIPPKPAGHSTLRGGVQSAGSFNAKLTARGVNGGHGSSNGKGSAAGKPKKAPILPPGHILLVGDSVMLGSAPNLDARLGGHRLTIDALVGRQAEDSIDRLAEYKAEGQLPSTVVVQLGDNGTVWSSDMEHLRQVLAGVPRVVIVNARIARSWQGEVLQEVDTYVKTWPQATLADWYDSSTPEMLTDGVHPSVAARANYANVIYDALRTAEIKSTGTTTGTTTTKSTTTTTKKKGNGPS